jgi:proprotein convertase subtilisin/kexin type 5
VYLGNCLNQCSSGSYSTFGKKECLDCPKLCTQCTSAESCMECRADGLLQEGKCLPHCSEGYYNDVGICSRCSQSCKSCIGPGDNECVTCTSVRKLNRAGRCVNPNATDTSASILSQPNKTCKNGYWYNSAESRCRPCHPSCSKCTGKSCKNYFGTENIIFFYNYRWNALQLP